MKISVGRSTGMTEREEIGRDVQGAGGRAMSDAQFQQLLRKSREAQHGGREAWDVMSTGEKVAVALVLNRADWLTEYGYTIPEAIDRAGMVWVSLIPYVARELTE